MSELRILVLAPDCNPDSITVPKNAYARAEALARTHSVTLVVHAENEPAVRRAGGRFHAIEPVRLPMFDRLYHWALRRVFKYDYGRQSLTAFSYPRQVAFEWRAWRRFRGAILSGQFDVVLRTLPIVVPLPSPFAYFLRNGPVPFVIGPLNGGLPWPEGLPQLDQQRSNAGWWISSLRDVYRYLPFARSTYSKAAAIIAGSSHTYSEFTSHKDKLFFIPGGGTNGLNPEVLERVPRPCVSHDEKLRLIYVGRLIPLKACDLALRAAAELLRAGAAHFTVVGDGSEREPLQKLARTLKIDDAVRFTGWLEYDDALDHLQEADVLVFPSLREFGGGVIFEALALGVVPVVVDFGGPGDIVNPDVGYKVPITNEDDMILKLETVLKSLANDRATRDRLRQQGMAYAREQLTWEGKARLTTDILLWATGRGPRPRLEPTRAPDTFAA